MQMTNIQDCMVGFIAVLST